MPEETLELVHGYLVSPLSENISETPEGFLIVHACPVARTGWMSYLVKDLPQESARELGVDTSNHNAEIDLYRDEDDVFDPEFLASLEGKSVTDGHPPGFVTPDTFSKYAMGHIQNVRRGDEPLEDGEWPIVADLVISAEPLVSKVRNKQVRDVSLGYDFAIERDGAKICQCGMLGNHAAIVPKGRAGDLISIGDEAGSPSRAAPPEPAALPPEPSAGHAASKINAVSTNKERPKVKISWSHIFGRGLRAMAADAEVDPEDLTQAAMDFGKKHAADNEDPDDGVTEVTETQDKGKARDRKGKDVEIGEVAKARDRARQKAHDDLDDMLDGKKAANDEDIKELKNLLDAFPMEKDEEEVADADPSELEEVLGKGEEPDAEDEEMSACGDPACEGCAMDEEEVDPGEEIVASGEEEPVMDRARAADSARVYGRAQATDAVRATLKALRPFVARSNDSGLKNAFNTMLSSATRSSRASTGGYGEFGRAARTADQRRTGAEPAARRLARANDGRGKEDPNVKLQQTYDDIRLGRKPAAAGGK
jgi:hypothetical protein